MLRVRRRSTIRSLSLVLAVALSGSWLVAPTPAGARSITQTQTAMKDLSAALARQEQRSETSANQYDADEANLASINGNISTLDTNIANLKVKEAKKRAQFNATQKEVVIAVVHAFVLGVSQSQVISLFNQNVNEVISTHSKPSYNERRPPLSTRWPRWPISARAWRVNGSRPSTRLTQCRHSSSPKWLCKIRLRPSWPQSPRSTACRSSTMRSLKESSPRKLITLRQEQAVTAASAVGGQNAANQVIEAETQAIAQPTIAEVAGTAQGAAAVKAAEKEIGVPYVWGGETPGVGFDCSGLVQWAWGQAGISIPRTTESQYPDMVHVLLTDLQPGDLLFYFNLDGDNEVDHVVMYVGSGPWGVDTTIAAAHTGTNVALAPLFTAGLIGAARP
jgi:hypothetical protein